LVCFKIDLGDLLDIEYSGDGHQMAKSFYIPTLKLSKRYDRVSGYFSVGSLVVVSTGLARLIGNEGRFRLVVGLHDLGSDLREAYIISRERGLRLVEEIGGRIAADLDSVEDVLSKRRLEALAWMLADGLLEVKVAVPKRTFMGRGSGIFHQKRLLFYDEDGCIVTATGSANETRMAWEQNGENLTVFMSWMPGHMEYINRHRDRFEALWGDTDPDFFVFTLPEAVEKKLREKYYPSSPPSRDPEEDQTVTLLNYEACERLVPAARLIQKLGELRSLTHLGLGPVRLYPHQVYVMDFALNRFPHRALIADEVGLGKTIEVGAVVKQLVERGSVERVLVLAPKNVTRQWQEELWYHFNLPFWRLETGPKRLIGPDEDEEKAIRLEDSNPFDRPGVDLMVASWHYARGSRRREPELLNSQRLFDLVVVDEAHSARRTRSGRENRPTLLNELCMELSIMSPHMLLVTATPVQLNALEAWDLLRILGLGGPWAHEDSFKRFYGLLHRGSDDLDEWRFAFSLASWVGRNYLSDQELDALVRSIVADPLDAVEVLREIRQEGDAGSVISGFIKGNGDTVRSLLVALSPVHWFMVRNNRKRLKEAGYTFPERVPKEVPVELEERHRRILEELDEYLRLWYGLYERMASISHRGVFGFVRSVYHQRFVSSFTAAYLTIRNRRMFLEAILRGDYEALLRVAEKLLEEVDWEGDEMDIVEAALGLLEKSGGKEAVERELERVRDLEYRLSKYAPGNVSVDDPKMRAIQGQVEELVGEGRRVLVFSKYTDTVDAVVEFLGRRSGVGFSGIGVYTGAGGRLYDHSVGDYVRVSKMEVRKALDEGKISVLVCSEAASEGLNLQAASAVVNVDMPWNPAKVEQRIGRVDRLGQQADRVLVRNVWYPESIEAEMYRRLFERGEVYKLVVGPAQEIVSEALRRALDEDAKGERLRTLVEETLKKIDEVKLGEVEALSGRMWLGGGSRDERIIGLLERFFIMATEALGLEARREGDSLFLGEDPRIPKELMGWNGVSVEVGRPNALTAAHPLVKWIAENVVECGEGFPVSERSLFMVRGHDGQGTLMSIEYEGGAPMLLRDIDAVAEVLEGYLEEEG